MGSRIAELLLDGARRLCMGQLGREEATLRFSSDAVARDTEALYLQVLG